MPIRFRPVAWEDSNLVARDMSAIDRWECRQIVPGAGLLAFVRGSVAASEYAWAWDLNGAAVGLAGIARSGGAVAPRVWFITTETLLEHKRRFLHASRNWMEKVNPEATLEASFHRDNVPTRRWLRWLGWRKSGEMVSTGGAPMITMEWRRSWQSQQ